MALDEPYVQASVLQAAEAIEWITGAGDLMTGRMLTVDSLRTQISEIAFARDPACPACGEQAARALPADAQCESPLLKPMLRNLTPLEIRDAVAQRHDLTLVDVREPAEHAIASIDGAMLVPLRTLPQQVDTLPRDHEIVLLCHHGMRSEMAGNFLLTQGFSRVSHMVGGIDRWSDDVDSTIAKY